MSSFVTLFTPAAAHAICPAWRRSHERTLPSVLVIGAAAVAEVFDGRFVPGPTVFG